MSTFDAALLPLLDALLDQVGPVRLPHCPLTPTARQEAFLRLRALEVLFGGAAGGGKSIALLMARSSTPTCPATTRCSCAPPGGVRTARRPDRALPRLARDTNAAWNGETRLAVPRTRHVAAPAAPAWFGYLDGPDDIAATPAAASPSSASTNCPLPRTALPTHAPRPAPSTNRPTLNRRPDGTTPRRRAGPRPRHQQPRRPQPRLGQDPLRRPPHPRTRRRLPASRLDDNPHLDLEPTPTQLAAAAHRRTRTAPPRRLGDPRRRRTLPTRLVPIIDPSRRSRDDKRGPLLGPRCHRARPRATPTPTTPSASASNSTSNGIFYIADIVRHRQTAGQIEQLVAATAEDDGHDVKIVIEQEPGAAGEHYRPLPSATSSAATDSRGPPHRRQRSPRRPSQPPQNKARSSSSPAPTPPSSSTNSRHSPTAATTTASTHSPAPTKPSAPAAESSGPAAWLAARSTITGIRPLQNLVAPLLVRVAPELRGT